jgi:hypothetical protein
MLTGMAAKASSALAASRVPTFLTTTFLMNQRSKNVHAPRFAINSTLFKAMHFVFCSPSGFTPNWMLEEWPISIAVRTTEVAT